MPPAPLGQRPPPDPSHLALVLASASPRRLDLLRSVGLDPVVDPADVDEVLDGHLDAATAATTLALTKGRAVSPRHPGAVVLGADTVVEVDGDLLAKPVDADDAARMLRRLSGRTHRVVTGVAVIDPAGEARTDAALATVRFHPLDEREIVAYVATGEPDDAAGAYAVQGRAAAFVAEVTGEPSTVIGLPVATTVRALRWAGIDVVTTWRAQARAR
ncbi:MAG TPA: Maf family protein [Acidimicrobiales bacterium]|nr:Maf family protein [Acidimicrobiales bacterium]